MKTAAFLALSLFLVASQTSSAETDLQALEQRVRDLREALDIAERELDAARGEEITVIAVAEEPAPEPEPEAVAENTGVKIGPVTLGGAVRVNYVYGSYEGFDNDPNRGGHGGNVELDTFRINASLDYGNFIGNLQYRWYAADSGKNYNFMHSGWIGYRLDEETHIELGLNRVPFGAGPYGISQSWFFDQHYYVGLADDPDLGIKYSTAKDNWSWDVAYYWRSEPSFSGRSEDSTRYGYDAVRWRESVDEDGQVSFGGARSGYKETDQFNLRGIYHWQGERWKSDLGFSAQYGSLDGTELDDGHHWAASLHAVNSLGGLTLAVQLSRFGFDIDPDNPWNTDKLIPLGAYDFAWPNATEGWIPAASLSYRINTDNIGWLDYVLPYVEASSIVKNEKAFNNSDLFVVGAAWAAGGWYIYSDLAYSNGNYFVGNKGDDYSRIDGVGDFGVAGNDDWNYRLNLNFGYYY